jgi:hypothetical protein
MPRPAAGDGAPRRRGETKATDGRDGWNAAAAAPADARAAEAAASGAGSFMMMAMLISIRELSERRALFLSSLRSERLFDSWNSGSRVFLLAERCDPP